MMDNLIARIATETGVDSRIVNKAVGMILAFLRKEGPSDEVSAVFAALPGSVEAADAAVEEDGGGTMGGGLMGLAGQLTGLGLGMGDMQTIGRHVFAYVREKAGDDHVGQIVSAIPGLGQFL
jgi:hypothetical protein